MRSRSRLPFCFLALVLLAMLAQLNPISGAVPSLLAGHAVSVRRGYCAGRKCVTVCRQRPSNFGEVASIPKFRWSTEDGWRRAMQLLEAHADRYDLSRMDRRWWHDNIKSQCSKLDVTCRECGHRSRSTTLNNLQKGHAPGCCCNGAVPWAGKPGHSRCLEMLQERYGEQYDASRMDWTWWQANVQGAESHMDVTCRECGHRSRSTTLDSFQQGSAPGCCCNGAVPWAGKPGHHRCLQMLQERYGDQYDASRMDWTWWQANVQGAESQIDVTCCECGHRSRSTTLTNLQKGYAPGCCCNGAVPWAGKPGHHRCLQMLQERYGEQYDASRMDWTWWQANVQNVTSKMDVTCRECGHRSRSTTLASLQKGQAPGCFCTGAVPWAGQQGHSRCLEMLQKRYGEQYDASRMDWTWWQANVQGAESHMDVTCRECGHRSRSTTLDSFQQGSAPGCFCNGAVPWPGQPGHNRFLEMLQERYGDQYDASRMDWTWWQANVQDQTSKIDVTCRECSHRSRSTTLANFQQGRAPGCLCTKRTEAKLLQWLVDALPQSAIACQVSGCKNPETRRTLPFDFGLQDNTILIELDGNIGHFGRGWAGANHDGGAPQRDLMKEQWALQHGRVVIRLLQEDVYADSWDWQGFLTSAIQHAIRNSAPCVLTQDAVQYKTGIYRGLRRGIPCKAGHFQAGGAGRVPYLAFRLPDENDKSDDLWVCLLPACVTTLGPPRSAMHAFNFDIHA